MWEFKSKVMVMLCKFSEEGTEACHPFWPTKEGDSAKYGKITVTLQSETSYENFFARKFLIHDDKVWTDLHLWSKIIDVVLVCRQHRLPRQREW